MIGAIASSHPTADDRQAAVRRPRPSRRATETLEYTFERAGEILAGCHEPGHYEAGMVTSMTVAVEEG